MKTDKKYTYDDIMVNLLYLRTFARICEDNLIEIIDEIKNGIDPGDRLEDVLHITELNYDTINDLVKFIECEK
ncbi:MAG: hypothetical protein KH968_05160 [Finegoldia magna]|uniref:hypothetical protein n=1 Tax=Finegoldia magna TaxID=1260 RepID=UPI00242D9E4C|nr:hypothetical protein [Finegoldia magna]MBS5971170.1 hypothetical protein [Finegoldia magna]